VEKTEYIVIMPTYIVMGVKKIKKYYINLNQYRNWHFHVSNNLKVKYKELVYSQIKDLNFNKIKLVFTYYKPSKRRVDRANILSIHEKFFCDALVESGCIPDDNDDYIVSTHYYSGGLDRENPRVEIKIIPLD